MAERGKYVLEKGWPYGLLIVLCVLVYWPMFHNGFVWDDHGLIVENPAIRGLWPPARFFQPQNSWIFSLKGHRPVMVFTLALDYALWKLNPFGYHLSNLLLHLLCVFGVALLAQRLSRSKGAGFLAGALFALLPGHAEAVIYFEGRADVLATLFVLLGLWGYVGHLSASGWRKTLRFLGSLVAFLVACFSKEMGLALLGILIIYEGFVSELVPSETQERSAGGWGRRALRLVPFLLIALFYLGYRGKALGGQLADSWWRGVSPGKNFLMTFEVYARYLRLLCFPLTLSPAHVDPNPGGFWDVRVLWGAALLLMTLVGVVWMLVRHPKAGFLASWFAIGLVLLLVSFIFKTWVAERFLYLPSVGMCALGGWGAWILYDRARGWTRTIWTGVIAVVLVLFGIRTWLWNPTWKNEESLARAIIASLPQSFQGYHDLGNALGKQGKYEEAIAAYRKAIELEPDFALAYGGLGAALADQGKYEEAIAAFRKTIELEPDDAGAYYNLGITLGQQGKYGEAIAAFRKAIELKPDDAGMLENLAVSLDAQGRRKEARGYWEQAEKLEKNPESVARIKKRLSGL